MATETHLLTHRIEGMQAPVGAARRRRLRGVAMLGLAAALSACGIPAESTDELLARQAQADAAHQAAEARLVAAVGAQNEDRWRQALRDPSNAALLNQVQGQEKLLTDQSDYVAAPRFTQTLALTEERALRITRAELLAELQSRLDGLKHVRREPSSPGAIDDSPETPAAAEGKLSRCDLLNLRLLLDFLARPEMAGEVLRIGAEDRADKTTEHGGAVVVEGGRLALRVMAPMFAGNDLEYVASDATMALVPTSVTLFHLHFHQVDNAENAGPGVGDLVFARTNHVSCVVFTSLDARSFDADYYNPQGAVVDLGVYHGGD